MTVTDLSPALIDWLPTQRWYGAKGVSIEAVAPTVVATLPGEGLRLVLAIVTVTTGGEHHRYQVPLSERDAPWADIDHALVGESDGHWYYDLAHDPDAATLLLDALAADTTSEGLRCAHLTDIHAGLRPRLIGAEQSNTSLVYGEEVILKIFRRVSPGTNPDLELTRALQDAGSNHVAPVLGWYETDLDGVISTLGVAQAYVGSATEGWSMATTSVRDLYAEEDLHADEVGGDFAAESTRLGAATAETHLLLGQVLEHRIADRDECAATAAQMMSRLEQAVRDVPQLEPFEPALTAAYALLADWDQPVIAQRIHGDLHLGQVLRTDRGWLILDFEGEPARPLSERTALMSPLRDVAGMLRSFDYAARSLLADQPPGVNLEYRAAEWAYRNQAAFCEGYASISGRDPREDGALLRAFELDKAVYEAVYEARNRPSWLSIPMSSLLRLAS